MLFLSAGFQHVGELAASEVVGQRPAAKAGGSPVVERLATEAQSILEKRIADGQLNLPLPGQVAARVAALARGTPGIDEAIAAIARDAVLAARVVRAAHEVPQAGAQPPRSLAEAAGRLGPERLLHQLTEAATHRQHESADQRLVDATRELRARSARLSLLAAGAATSAGLEQTDIDAALLQALVAEIGRPVVAWLLLEAEKSVVGTRTKVWIEPEAWLEVVERVQGPIGAALATRWGLPTPPAGYDEEVPLSAANCVHLARALCARKAGDASAETEVAEGGLLLGLDDAALAELCNGLDDRVRSSLG